ncbi:sigma factor G inhibitor Gin [Bacillus sp. H-16]|uniref:Sigma factor G inhibitor Gin n=2 Tax=Bacillaceae TaxID=186817 RepID=A0A3M7TLR0_9BACI|nr:sigma factor G inhibitor Gin [Alteribacter salitolerans]RNA66075.1 sigma factor G inhibitor Gin [Alteribacter keqinensis]
MLASKQTDQLQECLICKKEKGHGIHLLDHFICESCEHDLVSTDTSEAEYQEYLLKLRKIRDSLFQNKRSIH